MADASVPGIFSFEVDAQAEKNPTTAIVTFENGPHPDEVLTYETIIVNGRKLAHRLLALGFSRGDVLAVVMRNHPEFLFALYATSCIGAVLLPIDPRTKGERLRYVLTDADARGIIFTSEFQAVVSAQLTRLPDLQVVGVACKDGMEVAAEPDFPDLREIWAMAETPPPNRRCQDLDAPMEIIYTSGTTGDPKGVIVKNARLAAFGQLARGVFQYLPDDRLYTGLSLSHGNAQAVTLVPSLFLGIPSVFSRSFTKSRIWDICRHYGCTTFSLLGGMMMGIYSEPERPDDHDNPVRLVVSAGTPISIWEAFEKRFGVLIHEWYSAVEGGFAHKPPGMGPIGSFGKPLDGLMEMKVVRADDCECAAGEIGEIICRVKGQKAEVNYLGKEEASARKTRGGWLRSGDMGHTDENGWFFFDYRKGGGLRRAGDFIQPGYVEAALAESPLVAEVCVYGIPAASGAPGESDIVAAVVAAQGKKIEAGALFHHCRQRLEGNAVPSYLQIVPEIPKSASEKNLDRLLKAEFRAEADNIHALFDYC